jgi:predicted secreted Zn-dependent protease
MNASFVRNLLLSLFLFSVPPSSIADDILLHEGKTVHGKIIKEDKQEIMVRLANNMFLTVDKKKIKHITREDTGPARRVVRMESLQSPTTAAVPPAPKPEAPAAPAEPALANAAPKNIKPSATTSSKTAKGVTTTENLNIQVYPVAGKNFTEAKEMIFGHDSGKGFLKQGRRMASKTDLALTWQGKSKTDNGRARWDQLTIGSMLTVSYPEWKAPDKVDAASVSEWNGFIDELAAHDDGHVKIYRSALRALSETLLNLDSKNEETLKADTAQIIADWRARTERQQDGHDRRDREKEKTEKKPT